MAFGISLEVRAFNVTWQFHLEVDSGLFDGVKASPVIFCLWHNWLALFCSSNEGWLGAANLPATGGSKFAFVQLRRILGKAEYRFFRSDLSPELALNQLRKKPKAIGVHTGMKKPFNVNISNTPKLPNEKDEVEAMKPPGVPPSPPPGAPPQAIPAFTQAPHLPVGAGLMPSLPPCVPVCAPQSPTPSTSIYVPVVGWIYKVKSSNMLARFVRVKCAVASVDWDIFFWNIMASFSR